MVPRIQQIQIRNFRSIERAVVDLAPLTVLALPLILTILTHRLK